METFFIVNKRKTYVKHITCIVYRLCGCYICKLEYTEVSGGRVYFTFSIDDNLIVVFCSY